MACATRAGRSCCTVLLVVASVLPWVAHMSGLFYLAGALVLGGAFLWYAWKLLDPPDRFFAMRTFKYSIVYLMALFGFLLLDHWLLPWLQPSPAAGVRARRLGGRRHHDHSPTRAGPAHGAGA